MPDIPHELPVDLADITHHVVSASGGESSFYAAFLVAKKHVAQLRDPDDPTKLTLLFADTKIEDEDLYRFLTESTAKLRELVAADPPHKFVAAYTTEGRTPWDVFEDVRFIGNTRVDPCSRILKREQLRKWMTNNVDPDTSLLHVGIDYTEENRWGPIEQLWKPYTTISPLLTPDYYTELAPNGDPERLPSKPEFIALLDKLGIRRARLYAYGFAHNNCGGFCIKAGQASFAKLLAHFPERYMEHERREETMRRRVLGDAPDDPDNPEPVSILRDRTKAGRAALVGLTEDDLAPLYDPDGARVSGRYVATASTDKIEEGEEIPRVAPLPMRELRRRIQRAETDGEDPEAVAYDPFDIGGCGCMVPQSDELENAH